MKINPLFVPLVLLTNVLLFVSGQITQEVKDLSAFSNYDLDCCNAKGDSYKSDNHCGCDRSRHVQWVYFSSKYPEVECKDFSKFPELQNLSILIINKTETVDFNYDINLTSNIFDLPSLNILYISTSKVKALPENINTNSTVKQIEISGTKIKKLPNSIFQLPNLERFNLTDNPNLSAKIVKFKKSPIQCDFKNVNIECVQSEACSNISTDKFRECTPKEIDEVLGNNPVKKGSTDEGIEFLKKLGIIFLIIVIVCLICLLITNIRNRKHRREDEKRKFLESLKKDEDNPDESEIKKKIYIDNPATNTPCINTLQIDEEEEEDITNTNPNNNNNVTVYTVDNNSINPNINSNSTNNNNSNSNMTNAKHFNIQINLNVNDFDSSNNNNNSMMNANNNNNNNSMMNALDFNNISAIDYNNNSTMNAIEYNNNSMMDGDDYNNTNMDNDYDNNNMMNDNDYINNNMMNDNDYNNSNMMNDNDYNNSNMNTTDYSNNNNNNNNNNMMNGNYTTN